MSDYRGKVIKITERSYDKLHELKFELRVDTFDEVVSKLLSEHLLKQEVPR
jgi:hypothetical protein